MYNNYLEENNIYLREVREEDVNDEYYNWINDPEINQFLETRFLPRSKNDIIKHVQKMDGNPNEVFFAICSKETKKHIGNMKLGPINWYHRRGDVSLLIGNKEYWGKGIATEAIKLIIKFAFEILNLHKLNAGFYELNIGSLKAFEKCGFKMEGKFIDEGFCNGKYQNVIRVGIINLNCK